MITHIATTMYTWTDGEFVRSFVVLHYGHEPLFIKGYLGPYYNLGPDLRRLVEQGGRVMG